MSAFRACAILLLLAWLTTLTGCGLLTGKGKKPPPATGVVPATQRPYTIKGKTYYPLPNADGFKETGIASWYGKPFHGRQTSNGERFDMFSLTAAHKTLPMNTQLLVRNLENNQEVVVRVNDRGPFVKDRVIDLSVAGAKQLGIYQKGTAKVRLTALGEAVPCITGNVKTKRLQPQQAVSSKTKCFLPHEDFDKGEFFVQIASCSDQATAEGMLRKLFAQGKNAVIQPTDSPVGRFYRVQVRVGADLQEARRQERAFAKSGFPGAFVVAR